MDTQSSAVVSGTSSENGASLKWAFIHLGRWASSFVMRHWFIALLLVFTALLFREEFQPAVIWFRRFVAPVALSVGILVLFWFISRKSHWFKRTFSFFVSVMLVAGFVITYEYISLWVRYQSFHVEELDKLPQTGNERMHPLMSVNGLAQGVMGDSRNPSLPDFVWVKEGDKIVYKWTMGVEPKFVWHKIFGSVEEVTSVPATDPVLRFTPESRVPVHFAIGENLWLSSRAHTAVVRSFNPIKFFSYEPSDVKYLKDESGKFIEVISLIRWEGFLFPYPEFGGVIVIRQQPEFEVLDLASWGRLFTRVAFGAGEWIKPEKIQEFPYLRGQNILPQQVARYVGESLRFMNGIVAPFPGYHQGDVRIPDTGNINKQPYAVYFEATKGLPGMIYDYFSLEPYLEGKHGLTVSVLIPADGTKRVFVYKHDERNESLMGVSLVPALVRNSKMEYKWGDSIPIEERPYIRYVGGQRHFLWLTTIVTNVDEPGRFKDDPKKITGSEVKNYFITGSVPKVALVDTGTQEVYWVDPKDQDGWIKAITK